jgi:transcriptional regulator with XRE-family HTH domain
MSHQQLYFLPDMKTGDAPFFRQIGERIAQSRKERNMTQVELADMLKLKQYVIASYETGRRRVPVSLLPSLAKSLGISIEALMGQTTAQTNGKIKGEKPGPPSRLQQLTNRLSKLSRPKQKMVEDMLEGIFKSRA